ncbi:MAG TPA: DUF2017 domain-containing protein [Dermatophilaceae bacterium]|nr:DUF2017 domain-containing protein [Dermatophilaceae bacterium]
MAKAFKRKGDRFVARLDDVEREVVVGLMQQTQEFLEPAHREPTGDTFDDLVATLGVRPLGDPTLTPQTPFDPALERLLPPANREDPAMAAEFRRLTEHGLRERKTANLATAIAALLDSDGDKVKLDQAQAQAMVVALTDVRLLLGERLGLQTDDDADALQDRLEAASEDDPQLYLAAYYDFMTWLQESLTQALMS